IYSQLELFNKEYYIWRELLQKNPAIASHELFYLTYSKPMVNHFDHLVVNIIQEWVNIVKDLGSGSDIEVIKQISNDINNLIKSGKWIKPYYKSSEFKTESNEMMNRIDIVLCWKHDDLEIDKKVIEIKSYIPKNGL
ncbi:hypothetical protein, partial [Metabacillus niabensis]